MAIRIFITGGTFDKEYNELNGELYFKDTHMQDLLLWDDAGFILKYGR